MKKQRPKIPLLPYILFSLFSDSCSTCIISIPRVLSRYLSTCTVYSTMNTYRLVAQSITMQGTLEFEGEDVPSTTSWILPSAQLQVTIIYYHSSCSNSGYLLILFGKWCSFAPSVFFRASGSPWCLIPVSRRSSSSLWRQSSTSPTGGSTRTSWGSTGSSSYTVLQVQQSHKY